MIANVAAFETPAFIENVALGIKVYKMKTLETFHSFNMKVLVHKKTLKICRIQ